MVGLGSWKKVHGLGEVGQIERVMQRAGAERVRLQGGTGRQTVTNGLFTSLQVLCPFKSYIYNPAK